MLFHTNPDRPAVASGRTSPTTELRFSRDKGVRRWAPVLNDDQPCREAQLQRGLVASDGGRYVPEYPLMLKLILCLKETARLSDCTTRQDLVSTMAKIASSKSFLAPITGLAAPLVRLNSNKSDCGV
jgi:hypothetical protein